MYKPSHDHSQHKDFMNHGEHQKTISAEDGKEDVYTCPMHPEVIRGEPGVCPKCGMQLVSRGEQEKQKEMVRSGHEKMLWTHFTITLLGVWLLTSPFTFNYQNPSMVYSDLLSGALLIIFSLLSINPFRLWAPWASCFVGIWLSFAPLIFGAPGAAAYLNGTILGALVIALSVLIPGMPGMAMMMMTMGSGPETPPGWSYNPSSWLQRTPIIALGWIGFFGSRYLTAYQLGYINTAWDPFFIEGTKTVLTSSVSKAWPISDAGLGTFAYTIEALMGYMGGSDRWRTMPWMVTFFGILVVPLGIVSITLVILQPVAVGAWCTLCLVTAVAMLLMIPLTLDEVVAMIQFLVKKTREGKPFWRTFWMGDTIAGGGKDKRSPRFISSLTKTGPAMVWGVTVPWNLLLCTFAGLWLMFSPAIFGIQGPLADSDHLVGALVITFAVIAMAEVARAIRFINILFGMWIIAAPFILDILISGLATTWNAVSTGIIIILASLPKGSIKEEYGSYAP